MSIPRSQRAAPEILLLALAIILVVAFCFPVWYWTHNTQAQIDPEGKWTPTRIGRLLIGPEQILCYICGSWAALILLRRDLEVRRQRAAFGLVPSGGEAAVGLEIAADTQLKRIVRRPHKETLASGCERRRLRQACRQTFLIEFVLTFSNANPLIQKFDLLAQAGVVFRKRTGR